MKRPRPFACAMPLRLGILLTLLWSSAPPAELSAQSYRGWAGTSVQMIELRPLGVDTVPRADVVTDVDGRLLFGGFEVTCEQDGACTGYLPLGDDRTFAATQDLSLTVWGFGVEGLSVTTLLRARARAGGDVVWPRSDDEFDAMLAYAQLQRGSFRVRAGRQDIRSGLGFSGFDGLAGLYTRGPLRAELYGGRSLARGLREPAQEAFRGLDDFFVDEGVLVLGASGTGRWLGTFVTARYQREILWDRSSLVSERSSVDFSTSTPRVRVSGSADYDFSFEHFGKAHLTLAAPLAEGHWMLELTARRYVPYFDLSTVWGFFEPVSYSEVVARAGWSPRSTLGVWVAGGRRTYGDTGTNVVLEAMRDTGWRVDSGARWQVAPRWVLDGSYQLEWGPGGFLNSADAAVRHTLNERLTASLSALTFQQIEEYRLGEGRAFGVGASVDYGLSERSSVSGGFSLIRHRDGGNIYTSPWNQGRGWASMRFDIGRDPGLASRESGR